MLKNVTTQSNLQNALSTLFPDKNVLANVRREGKVLSPHSGLFLELDFWIPELKLAFEFQDQHHYVNAWYPNPVLERMKLNDGIKKKTLEDRGETLVAIPCWWDGSLESLKETIRIHRPELVGPKEEHVNPIDPHPPPGFFVEWNIPDVGNIMLPSKASSLIPENCWISENYQGVRAIWHPAHRTLYSRYNRPFTIPSSYLKFLSDKMLDGELWFGRLNSVSFQELNGRVHWEMSRYCVYDCPAKQFSSRPFEERFSELVQGSSDYFAILVPHFFNKKEVDARSDYSLSLLSASEGSGLFFRLCSSLYEGGRSYALIEMQGPLLEALVTFAKSPGYTLLLPQQRMVAAVGEGQTHMQEGDVVRFTCGPYVKGIPTDVKIREIVPAAVWNHDPLILGSMPDMSEGDKTKPIKKRPGHWTENEGANMRRFFDDFARARGLDPLVPESWYSFSLRDVFQRGNGYAVYKHYRCSLRRALIDVYPEVNFELSKWKKITRQYWNSINNRRAYFDSYARKNNFDPLVPDNWYSISKKQICKESKGSSVLARHGYSVVKALLSIYPSIGLDESKFKIMQKGYWKLRKHRKKFFDTFAAKKGMDPLAASSWYQVRKAELIAQKGGKFLKTFANPFEVLMDAYPDIGLQKQEFITKRNTGKYKGCS